MKTKTNSKYLITLGLFVFIAIVINPLIANELLINVPGNLITPNSQQDEIGDGEAVIGNGTYSLYAPKNEIDLKPVGAVTHFATSSAAFVLPINDGTSSVLTGSTGSATNSDENNTSDDAADGSTNTAVVLPINNTGSATNSDEDGTSDDAADGVTNTANLIDDDQTNDNAVPTDTPDISDFFLAFFGAKDADILGRVATRSVDDLSASDLTADDEIDFIDEQDTFFPVEGDEPLGGTKVPVTSASISPTDLNNDGIFDVVVTGHGLYDGDYVNYGDGLLFHPKFEETGIPFLPGRADSSVVEDGHFAIMIHFVDIDKDGYLDMLVPTRFGFEIVSLAMAIP